MSVRSIARRASRGAWILAPWLVVTATLAYVLFHIVLVHRIDAGDSSTVSLAFALMLAVIAFTSILFFQAYRRGRDEAASASREMEEGSLQESEERFRKIFDHATLGIVLRDREGHIVRSNAAFGRMFAIGGGDDEVKRVASAVVSVPELVEGRRSIWNRETERFCIETSYLRSDGRPIWYRMTESLLPRGGVEPVLSIAFFEDVGERKRVESELGERRERYRKLVEITDDFVWECDVSATFTFAGPRCRDILGREPAEIVGLSLFDLMPQDELPQPRAELADHLRRRKAFRMRRINFRRNGERVLLETTATPLLSADGAFIGFWGIDRDITEREHDRDELSRLATAIAAAGDAIIITDRDGVIEYVNPAFEKMTGYRRWEAIGATPRILKSGRQPQEVYERLWADLVQGKRWDGHFVNKRRDGLFYDAEVTISPIFSNGGTVSGFVAVQRDVTEHVALLGRLRDAQEMERLGQLVGGVAHEVRNPLNAIQVATATLELDLAATEEEKALFDVVHTQVDRLTRLMRDLLEFGKPVLKTERCSAARLCFEALLVWRGSHGPDANRARFTARDQFDAEVQVDSVRMQQVIINLLDNALQHSPAEGEIVLGCDDDGAHVRIFVSDVGSGLEPEFASRIFEPFFTRRAGGTGLGLSLVKNVTERHGGHVVVRNREGGVGVIAEVFLPVVAREVATAVS